MAFLHDLPPELVSNVVEFLTEIGDRAALAATDHRFYTIVNPLLYQLMAQTRGKRAIFWGALNGQLQTVRLSLDAGVDPDFMWCSHHEDVSLTALYPTHIKDSTSRSDDAVDDDDTFSASEVDGDDEDDIWDPQPQPAPVLDPDVVGSWPWNWTATALSKWTALHLAAVGGHTHILKYLLDSHKDPKSFLNMASQGLPYGSPTRLARSDDFPAAWIHAGPLYLAIAHGHVDAATSLISRGAWIHDEVREFTPLHAASQFGLVPLIEVILREGCGGTIDQVDDRGHTPLMFAVLHRKWTCAEWLLKHGADIHKPIVHPQIPPRTPLTPFIWVIAGKREDGPMLDIMIRHQPFADRAPAVAQQALMAAAKAGNPHAMKAIMQSGADPQVMRNNANKMLLVLLNHLLNSHRVSELYELYAGAFKTVSEVNDAIDTIGVLVEYGASWHVRVRGKKFLDSGSGGATALEKLRSLMNRKLPGGFSEADEERLGMAICLANRITIDEAEGKLSSPVTIHPRKPHDNGAWRGAMLLDDLGLENLHNRQ